MEYKKLGYLPEALLNFLLRLGWSHGDQEIFDFNEMLEYFDPSNINASASSYNISKLNWLNAHYIKNLDYESIAKRLKEYDLDLTKHKKGALIVDVLKQRATTLVEFKTMALNMIDAPQEYDQKACKKFLKGSAIEILEKYLKALKVSKELVDAKEFEEFTNTFMATNDLKLKALAQPIRIAMVGNAVSPSIFEVLEIVGFNEVINRVEKLLKRGNYE